MNRITVFKVIQPVARNPRGSGREGSNSNKASIKSFVSGVHFVVCFRYSSFSFRPTASYGWLLRVQTRDAAIVSRVGTGKRGVGRTTCNII